MSNIRRHMMHKSNAPPTYAKKTVQKLTTEFNATLNKGCRLAVCFREISQKFFKLQKSSPSDDGKAADNHY